MTKPDRTPCINPSCRRTAPRDADDAEIICGRCFRALPAKLRDRFKQLRRREKMLLRLIDKRIAKGTVQVETIKLIEGRMRRDFEANWQAIRTYFRSASGSPVGLDGFLREIGL